MALVWILEKICEDSKFGGNLELVSMSSLVNPILVNLVKVSSGGQQQKGSPSYGLG
jgi:hypothetical protein